MSKKPDWKHLHKVQKNTNVKRYEKCERYAESIQALEKENIEFATLNDGLCLKIGAFDFYPTRQRMYNPKTAEMICGLYYCINRIKEQSDEN